ncbi:MAG TPA: glycerol-3-phosphate dehydrogenase [Steroidobacteraceae bacterium]|nr:glycerol-3-phosphate dehydrogenase [Steroidobacteraceae bacterium]
MTGPPSAGDPTPERFDLLVIGGGINGAGIARDAVGRGFSVCLIEQADLGAATSSASTKLIHGGLRYLEYGELRLVRESLIERGRLLALAPHLIRPLEFVLPHVPQMRERWKIRLALALYDRLGGDRRLPASRALDLRRDARGAPLRAEFAHGFSYCDCRVDDSRLVVTNALDAAARGARILPRTRLLGASPGAGGWAVELLEVASGRRLRLQARVLVNAAGPWVDAVRETLSLRGAQPARLIRGSHIVVPRLFAGEQAYLLQSPDRRVLFAIPYEERFTLIGTTDVPFSGDPWQARASAEEIAYLCEGVSRFFTRAVVPQEVVWSYSGVRSLKDDAHTEASAVTRDYALELQGPPGAPALAVIGGKITTYRRLAEAALERLAPCLGASRPWTGSVPLPGGALPGPSFAAYLEETERRWGFLPATLRTRLARAYGTRMERVLGAARSLEDLGEDFGAHLTAAEVDYLRSEEWARSAEDILWRRSKLGLHVPAGTGERLDAYLEGRTTAAHARVRG